MRRLQRRYGDVYRLKLPAIGNAVIVSHPDLVKRIFTADPKVLHGGESPLGQVLGPGSLFSMDEEKHLNERRALLPPFHGDRMRSYEGLIEEEALSAMAMWPEDQEFATLPSFQTITLRVILRAVFGAEGTELAELQKLLPPMTALGQRIVSLPFLRRPLGRFSPGARFMRMRRRYDGIVGRLVDKHLADPGLVERSDILALMLTRLRESDGEIDRSALGDELLSLLVAGHETTSSSLAWSVERLRRHPDALRRLKDEAEGNAATLRTSMIHEILRQRPVIGGTGRIVREPFELGEWRLPPGVIVIAAASVIHDDERFHDRAREFDIDRYVDRKPDTYAWIPFGGGTRRCLGASFALFEMEVVLRTMLRRFELVTTDEPGEPESFRGVAFAPGKGGVGRFRRRREPLDLAARRPSNNRIPLDVAGE
jgi:cytochrome P450